MENDKAKVLAKTTRLWQSIGGICLLKVNWMIEITNIKQIPMTKIQKSKQELAPKGFGHWILEFEICL